MKAKILPLNRPDDQINPRVLRYRKETALDKEIAAIDPATGRAIVTARIYYPGTVAYACVWIHGRGDLYRNGAGKAGGYGYHKESAALHYAIDDAGIELSESIGARGNQAMIDAVEAIARKVSGKRRVIVHLAHG